MVLHLVCSAFISEANHTLPSSAWPQYSEQMPMGSRAAQNCPVRSSQITHAKMPSRLFHSSLESPYLREGGGCIAGHERTAQALGQGSQAAGPRCAAPRAGPGAAAGRHRLARFSGSGGLAAGCRTYTGIPALPMLPHFPCCAALRGAAPASLLVEVAHHRRVGLGVQVHARQLGVPQLLVVVDLRVAAPSGGGSRGPGSVAAAAGHPAPHAGAAEHLRANPKRTATAARRAAAGQAVLHVAAAIGA